MPSIWLIPIDDTLRRVVDELGEGFAGCTGRPWVRTRHRDRAVVVGTCGFTHGPEADGSVEIAYFTFPEYEGRGDAKAMARELLARGLQSGDVRDVIAHTLPERNASTRILESVGMLQVGEADDAEVGRVWRWAYRPSG